MALRNMAELVAQAQTPLKCLTGERQIDGALGTEGQPLRLQFGNTLSEIVVTQSTFISEFREDGCESEDIGIGIAGERHQLRLSLELTTRTKP